MSKAEFDKIYDITYYSLISHVADFELLYSKHYNYGYKFRRVGKKLLKDMGDEKICQWIADHKTIIFQFLTTANAELLLSPSFQHPTNVSLLLLSSYLILSFENDILKEPLKTYFIQYYELFKGMPFINIFANLNLQRLATVTTPLTFFNKST